MTTTDLKLQEPGSLAKPGPIGRAVRLLFGLACLLYVSGLIQVADDLIDVSAHIRPLVWNGIFAGLLLVCYVINIGFSRPWKKWPAIVSGGVFLALAGAGFLSEGWVETAFLARTIWVWDLYIFSHLGVAFVISGAIGTPGCEMRAFHDLYSRVSGTPTKEHYCPVGPLHPIDRWEADRNR